jgi:hypothetical protein
VIVNLDPANDFLPYECAVNIADLITVDDVMEKLELGPNGGKLNLKGDEAVSTSCPAMHACCQNART